MHSKIVSHTHRGVSHMEAALFIERSVLLGAIKNHFVAARLASKRAQLVHDSLPQPLS